MKRTLVMWCPAWSVVAAVWDEELPDVLLGKPVAIVHKGCVQESSPEALRAGVRVGMRRRDAHAICPEVTLTAHKPERDRAFFDRVIIRVSEHIPQHTLLEPGLLAFQARGVERFYGSEATAADLLIEALAQGEHAIHVRIGAADDLFSAVMAARHTTVVKPVRIIPPGGSPAFLAGLPVTVLDDERTVSLLLRLGVDTLGGFVALGKDAVRERFGSIGERLFQLAEGGTPSALALATAPVNPECFLELPEAYELVDQVAFAIRAATDEYDTRLSQAGVVATRVRITLSFESGVQHTRLWLHPRFFTSAELVDRVRWQLEQCFRDSASTHPEAPHGVVAVRYETLAPEDKTAHEPGLWGQGPDARVHQVLSRVQGMVGASGVQSAQTHRARFATDTEVLTSWGDKTVAVQAPGPLPGSLPRPLPATVFSTPRDILLIDAQGQPVILAESELSAPPAWMRWGEHRLKLTSWAGPWPVYEKWWDTRQARSGHRLQVLDENGVGWLMTATPHQQWRLEARYD